MLKFTIGLFKHHIDKLKNEYKKINNMTEWNVKEGKHSWYAIKNINIDGLEASVLIPNNSDEKKVILQLHGGGYELDLPSNNLYFAKKYAKLTKKISVLTINYRVAPDHKYPAALEDAIKAYKWLLNNEYNESDILIVGDSCGGGLAIASVMFLRDNKIPLPSGVITMSAWTDLTNSQASFTKNFKIDPVFGNSNQTIVFKSTYADNQDKTNPYISPLFGDFKDLPPMLMQVGSYEMLLNDTTELARKARKQGVSVRVTVYKGMFHVFQNTREIIPESSDAWKEVRGFIEDILNI